MEPKQNYRYLIDDNARLQQENWKFKKAGCSNENHITLVLQLEEKDKLIENTKNELQIQIQQANNSTIDDLKNQLQSFISEQIKSQKDNDKIVIEKINEKNKIIEQLQIDNRELNHQLKQTNNVILEINSQIKLLQEKLEKQNKNSIDLKQEYKQNSNTINETMKNNKLEVLDILNNKEQSINNKIDKLQKENETLRNVQKDNKISNLEIEIKDSKNSIQSLTKDQKEMKINFYGKCIEIAHLKRFSLTPSKIIEFDSFLLIGNGLKKVNV